MSNKVIIPLSMATFLAISPVSVLATYENQSKPGATKIHKELKAEMKAKISSSSLKVNAMVLASKTSNVPTTSTKESIVLVEELKDKVNEVVEGVEEKVNEENKADVDLLIDSTVTSFGSFTASETLKLASGSIKLQGDVKKEDIKLHPVYKFHLENDESTTLTGLTATIKFPDGYMLDERFPQLVMITPTNKNPLMEDVTFTLSEGKDGMTLNIPDLSAEEKLHFDVKFFLVKKAVEPITTDEMKAKVSLQGNAALKMMEKKVELIPTIKIVNQNEVAIKSCSLHFKVPVNFKVDSVAWLNGVKTTFKIQKDGTIVVMFPELPKGNVDFSFKVKGEFKGDMEKLALPLTLMAGEELVTLQSMKLAVSNAGTDSEEETDEKTTGTGGTSAEELSGSDSTSEVAGDSETSSTTQVAEAYDSGMLPKTGSFFSSNILMILGAIAMGIGGFFFRRGQWNGQ